MAMNPIANPPRRQLASDIYSTICPEAWAALAEATRGHSPPYGTDEWTERARQLIRRIFETDCDIYFVLSGTMANSLALAGMAQPYHGILCHQDAHIHTTECGGPEFFTGGARLIPVAGIDGKIAIDGLREAMDSRSDVHVHKPRAISLTQATERGTVYSLPELSEISQWARSAGLLVHMDGARFANALVSLDASPARMSWQAGIDVLSFGLTKTGGAACEAIVIFNKEVAREFALRHKQAGQLVAKMRFQTAPWVGMLADDAWLRHARRANELAAMLEQGFQRIPAVRVLFPCQANMLFARIPRSAIESLHARGWTFYTVAKPDLCRFVTSWDNTESDVLDFLADLQEACSRITPNPQE